MADDNLNHSPCAMSLIVALRLITCSLKNFNDDYNHCGYIGRSEEGFSNSHELATNKCYLIVYYTDKKGNNTNSEGGFEFEITP